MASRKLRFAIFGNTYQPKKSESFQKLLACLMSRRAEVLIEREFYTFLTEGQQLPVEGVKVFGTNSRKTKLLRINPFEFPGDVELLEHIDSLLEIAIQLF